MKSWGVVLGCALILSSIAVPASAVTYLGTTQFTCTDFNASGTGAAVLDRDNTGTGEEAVRIDVTDGTGANIFTFSFTNALGSYSGGLITLQTYTTPPVSNPLTITVTSLAGNGLPELVGYTATGTCAGLPFGDPIPTLSALGLIAFAGILAALALVFLIRRARA